jgi:hypothetical protein
MSPHRERVMRGSVVSEHLVHLFDESGSLVNTVATYLLDGWRRGDTLVVIARASNWALTAAELTARDCPVEKLAAAGRLIVFDAPTTLASLMVNGEPDRKKFDELVGALVHRLCRESSAGVTAYGEMVDILAAQGNFIAAEHLETLWNNLSTECSFRLLCGYSSAHFGDARTAQHLDRICAQHTYAGAAEIDLLASRLLAERRSKFHIPAR